MNKIEDFKDRIFNSEDVKEIVDLQLELNQEIENTLQALSDCEYESDEISYNRESKDLKLLFSLAETKRKELSENSIRANHNFRFLAKSLLRADEYRALSKASRMYFKQGQEFINEFKKDSAS